MRLVSSDLAKSITKGVKTNFMKGMAMAPQTYKEYASVIPMETAVETVAWLGNSYKPHAWVDGDRVIHDLSEYYFTLTAAKYEATLGVDVETLEDEQYGQIAIKAQQMGMEAGAYIDELVGLKLADALDTGTCYDGQTLCSDSHSSKNSGTQDNKATGALSGANVTIGVAAMRNMKDDQGRYLNISPDTIIVPPALEGLALEINKSMHDPDNANNPVNTNFGRFGKVIVTPYLDATFWFLAYTGGPVKPMVWGERVPVTFESDTTQKFMKDKLLYGTRFRGVAGFGEWRYIYGSTGGA